MAQHKIQQLKDKEKMKKLLLSAGLLASLTLLVACGQKTEAQKDQKTEIEFWYGLGSEAGKLMEKKIEAFNKSQDKVVVKGVQQADYDTTWKKTQAAIAAKKAPEVFLTGTDVIQSYGGDKGVLADLEDLNGDKNFKSDELLSVFTENNKVDGKTYGIPAYGTTQIIYYNKDVLKKAGVDPKTAYSSWEKIAEAGKKIKASGVKNGHMVMWGSDNLSDMALSNGGKYLSEDKKTVLINDKAWVEAWEFARQQIFDTKNMSVISGGQGWEYWYKTIDTVMNGTSGSYTGSSGDRANLDFKKIDATPQPGLNGNQAKPVARSLNMAIPKTASKEEKAAAQQWISYFTGSEVQSDWSLKIGYVPVRSSVSENADYQKFIKENAYADVALQQAKQGSAPFIDPTKGKILDALKKAADAVELQNVPAKEALDKAQKEAQDALDKANKGK